jgi:hypothetical protein
MKKVFKQLFFSVMCMMALATIASCDKDSNSTGSGTPVGGGITPAGYVDLGLPSGTLWKSTNEPGFYTYDDALKSFGDSLPTKAQLDELKYYCEWIWEGRGFKVVGPNGDFIFLPAAGYRNCSGGVDYEGSYGLYWSSTPDGSEQAWRLGFGSGEVGMYSSHRCCGLSVRLVQ